MSGRLPAPVICVVTDRRRLPGPAEDSLVALAELAAAAGVDLFQLREPGLDSRLLHRIARRAVDAAGRMAVMVNDRTDVALAAGAHGVHLRADSPPAERVRRIVPDGFLIGRSVHGPAEAIAGSQGADYLIAGTVYPTPSKPGIEPAGPPALAAICRSVTLPVLAIGGVTSDNVRDIAASGASGVAAIGMFAEAFGAGPAERREAAFRRLVAAVRQAFAPQAPLSERFDV